MTKEFNVLKSYAIGDVAFLSEWKEKGDINVWVKLRYAGYSKKGTLLFQWMRGSKGFNELRGSLIPITSAVQEMRVEIEPLHEDYAVAIWRVGPGEHDFVNVCYALGDNGELLEIEASCN